ncbi:MAG: cohesin domain-containing protein [Candidatus Bathyarchaeota archaeon]|nr:cohesin domain-containing protein [Candidatus Bathyarchaeota archaeon]
MKIKAVTGVIIWLAAITLLSSILTIKPIFAPEIATLSINPPSVIDPSKDIGTTFIINATVSDVVNLWNWQIKATFNPSVLGCARAWIPSDSPFGFPVQPTPIIDNDTGYVMLGASQLGTAPGVSGSGVLACIEFEVKGIGSSYINYSRPYGEDTYLLDPDMVEIPATLEDGYFSNWVPPPPAKLYVNPPRVVDPTLTPCHNFTLSMSITNATDLYAWQLTVPFPTAIIDVLNVTEGSFLKLGGTTDFEFDILYTFNATHGVVLMSCTIMDGVGVNGDGDLATITFHVKDFGETSIPIIEEALYDSLGNTLPHDTFNGYFNNMLIAKLSVEPQEIIDPTLVPCNEFYINITLDDVEDMKSCQFNLTYNTAPLGFIGITFFKVLNQTPTTSMIQSDEAGFVWIKLTYPNPITTYSPLPLLRITFHVDAFGTSPLNLTDTVLKDSTGQPIIHEVQNGYFASVIRDIAIIDVKTYSTWVYQGWLAHINVTVKNEGDLTETFDVKAFYDATLIGIITVENLPPNGNTTITLTWNTAGVPACHNYTISAEAAPVPYETDLTDNTFTNGTIKVRLIGDVNDDGKVDMADIGLICLTYGSNILHPRWNPEADLNQDKKIDMLDIGLAAINYGKSCP